MLERKRLVVCKTLAEAGIKNPFSEKKQIARELQASNAFALRGREGKLIRDSRVRETGSGWFVGRRSREELFWLCCGPCLHLKLLQQHFQSAAQSTHLLDFFLFFLHFPLFFKKYMVCENICKTVHLSQWGTAAGTYRRAPRRQGRAVL
jgi:hypothetical protein